MAWILDFAAIWRGRSVTSPEQLAWANLDLEPDTRFGMWTEHGLEGSQSGVELELIDVELIPDGLTHDASAIAADVELVLEIELAEWSRTTREIEAKTSPSRAGDQLRLERRAVGEFVRTQADFGLAIRDVVEVLPEGCLPKDRELGRLGSLGQLEARE